jgi:TRAP-type uncharacterized transport system fused permease subunit
MNGDPASILIAVFVVLLGIFMGTVAVVGYVMAPVPWTYRILYAVIALMLLAQPAMFPAAIWLNVAGVIAATAAIVREFLRGRAQGKPAPSPPAGQTAV